MADDLYDLTELVKINDMNLADLSVSDLLQETPVLRSLYADISSNGTDHKYLKETVAIVPGFRSVNDGISRDHSEDTLVTINLKLLDASIQVDSALVEMYRKGSEQALIEREAMRALKAAFVKLEKQCIYGTTALGDTNGFTGFINAATLDALADGMVVNAGGTTADVQTSVYAVRTGPDDCALIVGGEPGMEGQLTNSPPALQYVAGASGGYHAYCQKIQGWFGLQMGSIYSVGRICNIEDATDDRLTDADLSELLSRFPANRPPSFFAMNRSAHKMLQQSRTTYSPTGQPAPFPMEAFGIPIVVTDQIVSTEPVEV